MNFYSSFQPELLKQKDMRWLLCPPTIVQQRAFIKTEHYELKQSNEELTRRVARKGHDPVLRLVRQRYYNFGEFL